MTQSRRPTTTIRRWPLLAAGIVATLAVGAVIGRVSAPDAAPVEPADRQAPPTAEGPGPTGEGPGPTSVEDGVPVGYQRSRAGAVAAAVQFTQILGGAAVLDDQRRGRVLGVMAAKDARGDLDAAMEAGAALIREGFGLSPADLNDPGFVSRDAPAGYRVEVYSDDAATVALWSTGLIVVPDAQGVDAGWWTTTVELVWEDDDWRMQAFSAADGPSPIQAGPQTAAEIGRRMNAFEEFWHVPAQ